MEFTPRTKQILTIMLKEDQVMSARSLAEKVGVSKRTIQRELEYLSGDLKPFGIRLMSKTGTGIWLEGSREQKAELLREISGGDSYDAGNREERRKRLVLEILKDKGLKKLFYYSSKFKVSEATISGDLESMEGWLSRYGLHVVRKPGSGISIKGSEESYRRAIRAFINENIDTGFLRESYETDTDIRGNCDKLQQSSIGQILNDDILKRVINCMVSMNHERVMTLTESSYIGLVIHITIAINRILKNETIEGDALWMEELPHDEDYLLAVQIVQELQREFEIEIPTVEISYICLHIKGAKHEKIEWGSGKTAAMENRELQQLLNRMIDVFDDKNSFLLRQDEEFIQGLLAHLQPTIIRILHNMQISNPVLEEIRRDYPDIFERCRRVANVLAEALGKEVPEAEIGFLTVHFGAAMVRLEGKKENIRQVQVGVVCSSGIGISRLMASKLGKAFKDRIVLTAYGKNDITPYIEGRTDFFVSSIAMEPLETPVVFVNPLLNEEDMEAVRKMVYRMERTPKKQEETDFSVELDEINLVAAQINSVIKYMEFFKVSPDITFDELLIAIGEKLSPYRDRSEMIREDIRRREKISSQVFAELGFALFHTRTKGVIRPSFNVCMTKGLTAFENPYFKKITVVFIMLLPEDDAVKINSEILGYISGMLIEDMDFMDIVQTGDAALIREALSVHLKKFFSKYLLKM